MNARNTAIIPWLLVVLGILGVLAFAPKARAQDCEMGAFGCQHQENHEQYKGWTDNRGGSCCSGEDCRPIRARHEERGWQIYIPEMRRWIDVPQSALMPPDRFNDGRSHACTSKPNNPMMPEPKVYCFSPSEPRI